MRKLSIALITMLLFASAGFAQRPNEDVIALTGATVITGTGAPPIADAVILIRGDRIIGLGGKGTTIPAGITPQDLSGKFIIPGLIDSHVHYEEWMGEMFLNHGVTTALGIGTDFPKVKEESKKADVRTPRLYDTAGRPAFNSTMPEAEVRRNVREWLAKKPDFTKMPDYNDSTKAAYAWAADEIHKAGLVTFGHTENALESVQRGLDVVEHPWGFAVPQMSEQQHDDFAAGKYLHWGSFLKDAARTDELLRQAITAGAYLNPTMLYEMGVFSTHATEFENQISLLLRNQQLAAYYPPSIADSVRQRLHQVRNYDRRYENMMMIDRVPAELMPEYRAGYEATKRLVKRWVEMGGKIQAGTDTVTGGTVGLGIHQEMEMLVEAGLTPMQALLAATKWSAEMLEGKGGAGGSSGVGALQTGAFADLVVLSADPLRDIRNTQRIERVMKAGNFVKLGYTASYYTWTTTPRSIALATPRPEISAIAPHTVVEGSADFDLTITGIGFNASTVARVGTTAVPTTFVNPRTLRARVPARLVRSALPNPFNAPGPLQNNGVFGDPTLPVTVTTPAPEGGTSNSVSLRIRAKWMGLSDE